jgi:hypothetical protein
MIQHNDNSNQQPDPKSLEQSLTAGSKITGTVTNNLIQNHWNFIQQPGPK